MGKFEEAINDFSEVIRLNYDLINAYVKRGIARVLIDKNEDARADFMKVLELKPKNEKHKKLIAGAKKSVADIDSAMKLKDKDD